MKKLYKNRPPSNSGANPGRWHKKKKKRRATYTIYIHTAVSRKVVQLKSIKAYATIPKGIMGCGCSLLHRQVHDGFQSDGRRCYEYLFACVKRNKMDSELLACLLKFIEYFTDYLSALSRTLLRFFWTTFVETAVYIIKQKCQRHIKVHRT